MKKILSSLLLVLAISSSVFAYEFKEPSEYDVIDSQMWYFSNAGTSKLATGLCFGPVLEFVNKNGFRIGEVFRGCTMLSYDGLKDTKSNQISGGFGFNFISIMGVTGSVIRDPFENEWKFAVGFSLTQIYRDVTASKQLEQTILPATHPISFLSKNNTFDLIETRSLVTQLDFNLVNFN